MKMGKLSQKVYHEYLNLFKKGADGYYDQGNVAIGEDEILNNESSELEINANLKQDIQALKSLINRTIKEEGLSKDSLNYSWITRQIYSDSHPNYIELIEKVQDIPEVDDSDAGRILLKLLRHTELALVQKVSLSDRIFELEAQLQDEIEKNKIINKELAENKEKWEKHFKDLDEQMNKLMPEIIGIMGVFSTIIFAVFSGFNEITTLGQSLSTTPISKVLIYVGSTFIVLIGIVFISYLAIGYFFDINLRSCACESRKDCQHDLIEKHPTVLSFVWIGISFICVGAILVLFRDYLDTPRFIIANTNILIVLLFICLILVPFSGIYLVFNRRIRNFMRSFKQKNWKK